MRLSNHFTLHEMTKSQFASRHNIDNSPNAKQIGSAKLLAEYVLEPIRIHFGIPFSPNSWFRCEALETEICWNAFLSWSKKHSMKSDDSAWQVYFKKKSHPKGEAADIEIPGVSNDELFKWIRDESGIEYDQLIREFAKKGDPMSGWVHVSYSSGHNRHESFDIKD